MNRLAFVAFAALALSACAVTPPAVMEPVAYNVSQPQLESAIEASLEHRSWKIIEHTPGRYVAKIDARDRKPVLIAVTYDLRAYTISWVDQGPEFGERHPNVQKSYARWIEILHRDIEGRL